jgi:hypothetical protein
MDSREHGFEEDRPDGHGTAALGARSLGGDATVDGNVTLSGVVLRGGDCLP